MATKWPTVRPGGSLATGTRNDSSSVQNMALGVQQAIARNTFALHPKPNQALGTRGQRQFALGAFQSGDKKLGRQYYDVRFNVHLCKALILAWGRNAYSSDEDVGLPITASHGGQTLTVWCHIDITTPRENFLWHGIEGPHVVIERYKIVGDPYPKRTYKPKSNVFAITPDDLFRLYLWENEHNTGKSMKDPARTWPQWLLERLVRHSVDG
jgi:hypothetical protein